MKRPWELHVLLFVFFVLSVLATRAGTYSIDPAHTHIGFAVSHLGISETKGFFREFHGTVEYDPESPADFSISGAIKTASIDTAIEMRDKHLRGPDFFDVEKYPEITFLSESVEYDGARLLVTGPFTMRGVTRTITIPITVRGPITDAFGKIRIGLAAQLVLNRQDYGMTWSQVLDRGGLVIGNEVRVTIEAEAILNQPAE